MALLSFYPGRKKDETVKTSIETELRFLCNPTLGSLIVQIPTRLELFRSDLLSIGNRWLCAIETGLHLKTYQHLRISYYFFCVFVIYDKEPNLKRFKVLLYKWPFGAYITILRTIKRRTATLNMNFLLVHVDIREQWVQEVGDGPITFLFSNFAKAKNKFWRQIT